MGGFIRIYTPKTADKWKGSIVKAVEPFLVSGENRFPKGVPLSLNLFFYLPRPKAHYTKKGLRPTAPTFVTTKPDFDNLAKAVADAITPTGLWADDCQIVHSSVDKLYANEGEEGVFIRISEFKCHPSPLPTSHVPSPDAAPQMELRLISMAISTASSADDAGS